MEEDAFEYNDIIHKAEGGDPSAMFELAKLYDCGAISSSYDIEYIYWLKRFMESDLICSIIDEADDEEGRSQNDSFDFIESYQYYPMIVEAGISLGLYYKNSSNIDEVQFAQRAFYNAYIISRFDYIEVDDAAGVTDILTLLSQTNDRIALLSGGTE